MSNPWRHHKEKFILVGLPRSGTTIAANYINSMRGALCLIEPHWEYVSFGSTTFFEDPKIRLLHLPKVRRYVRLLRYHPDAPLPLDEAVRRIMWLCDLVGIKETYRANHYSRYDSRLPNEDLLTRYVDAGYRLIPILRHPLAVWNSFCGHFSPEDHWAADLEGFIENYQRFCDFAGDRESLIYEEFASDPEAELRRAGIGIRATGRRTRERHSAMGDAGAKQSTVVSVMSQAVHYTAQQKESLEASPIPALYEAAVSRASASPLNDDSPGSGMDAGRAVRE